MPKRRLNTSLNRKENQKGKEAIYYLWNYKADKWEGQAPGIDGITANDIIIAKDDDFLESILMVINQSIEHSIVPKSLKQSVVRPIYKNEPHADYNNYRPISFLPLLSKILEAHIFEVMANFLAKNSMIYPEQFGSQKEKGANDLLKIFANTLNTSLNNHIPVLATFVDFSKAFDTLNNSTLLETLENYGARGKLQRAIPDA